MHRSHHVQAAQKRLKSAAWPSSFTTKAMDYLADNPTETDLLQTLKNQAEIPVALEALCALQPDSPELYDDVCRIIASHPSLSWSMIDSLNHLAWYDGMRAFMRLPNPLKCCKAYPFYILARNKIFYPSDMAGTTFEYHVKGFWALLATARLGHWQQLQPNMLAVVNMLHTHLNEEQPNPFITYFCALLLGGFQPLKDSTFRLKAFIQEPVHPALNTLAILTLGHLHALHNPNEES